MRKNRWLVVFMVTSCRTARTPDSAAGLNGGSSVVVVGWTVGVIKLGRHASYV